MMSVKDEIYKSIPDITKYSKTTKAYMKSVIDKLDQLNQLEYTDCGALSLLASNYELTHKLNSNFLADPDTYLKDKTNINIQKAAERQCLALMLQFGLTTKARQRMEYTSTKTTNQTNNAINEFLDDNTVL